MTQKALIATVVKRAFSAWGFCLWIAVAGSGNTVHAQDLPPGATNRTDETNAQDTLRGMLQLQEQIHATQLTLERIRKDNSDAAAESLTFLANRLQAIENTMTAQRGRELDALQSSNHTMVLTSAALTLIGLSALLLMAFFQWRTVNRLAEISSGIPALRALGPGTIASPLAIGAPPLVGTGPAELSSQRLLGAMEKLEKRIHDLEHTTEPSAVEADARPKGNGHGANGTGKSESEVSALLHEGQRLLEGGSAEEALGCFESALKLQPHNTEALVKKGTALEKLGKLPQAIECYDEAIAADSSMTIAYLYKGGVFNRMERFAEALACYEQALRTQEKRAA